jgi:catechol 2,3-dioxygenase-like lactoylglutathione lyase family enzyme
MVDRTPRLTHVLLFVAGLQRTRDFYLGALGLELVGALLLGGVTYDVFASVWPS